MKYSSLIDNITSKEWGLTIQLAYLFDWIYSLPSWASPAMIDSREYFFASKTKAVEELPLLTDKVDTMYRYYKQLEELDLIHLKKVDGKDFICLTDKGRFWGRKSEHSENNPSRLGNKSEFYTENNPTYKTTSNDKITIDKRANAFGKKLAKYVQEFGKEMVREFYEYWIESNDGGTKMRFESEKFFSLKRRLNTWKKRDEKFAGKKEENLVYKSPIKDPNHFDQYNHR